MRLLKCLWLLTCLAQGLASSRGEETNYFVQSWQVEEGLPYSTVHKILQDPRGYLWLATVGGLVRFDGVNFKEFTSPLVASTAARNVRSLALEEDATLLLLPAIGGIVRFRDDVFTPHPASASLEGRSLDMLFVEPGGALWIGLSSEGVARWENGRLREFGPAQGLNRGNARVSFATDAQKRTWIASGDFLGFYRDGNLTRVPEPTSPPFLVAPAQSGGIWLVAGERLYQGADGKLTRATNTLPKMARGGFRILFETADGALWLGTSGQGLFRSAEGRFVPVRTSQSTIASLAEDHEGSLWAATSGGGINRLRPRIFRRYDSRAGLLEDVSEVVCEDSRGDVWLGNRSGGLARIRDGEVSVIPFQQGRLKLNVSAVCADDAGQIWVAANSGLYRFPAHAPEQLEHVRPDLTAIHVLFKSRRGDVWVGADAEMLGRFRGRDFKSFQRADGFTSRNVRAIAEDAQGRIWVGTERGDLFRSDGERFVARAFNPEFAGAPIHALHVDAEDTVWIGTTAGGVLVLRHDRMTRITRADGLPDDVISQLVEDDRGRLWFGSRRGIFWAAKKELLSFVQGETPRVSGVTFGKSEGLAGVYCLSTCQPASWKSRDGWLWFTTHQGVLALNPAAMKPNAQPPPVYIEELLVNDRPVALSDAVRLPPRPNKLEFRFAALSFAAPEKVRLRHRLEGVDSDWIETMGQRTAVYGRLPAGAYQMRVIASNNDGVWNEAGATVGFHVQPAWWQTWWFYALAVGTFTGLVAWSVRYWSQRRLRGRLERLEQQRALERERARIARDLHDDLGASLTQIGLAAEMSRRESAPPEELKKQSAQLAAHVRTLARELDAIVWTVNPRNDSLDKLATYLCQFSQEFFRPTQIRCRLDVAEDIPAHALTPEIRHDVFLASKEALNNVVKHSGATEVWLRLAMNDGCFEIKVEDNGRGFCLEQMTDSERNGLRNMRARVEEMGGAFAIHTEPGKGTRVSLRIPLTARAAPHSIER